MWFLIQILVLVCSIGSFAFTLWSNKKTDGLVRATARTAVGSNPKAILTMAGYITVIAVFARMGWHPLACSALISLSSLIWAWSSPKSLEDFAR